VEDLLDGVRGALDGLKAENSGLVTPSDVSDIDGGANGLR
jgi:hypothetical protein